MRRGWRCARGCRGRGAPWWAPAFSPWSPECGGGDSISARSSAASTARRRKPGWRRSKPRTRRCARKARGFARKATQQEIELAMTSGAQASLSQAGAGAVGRERAAQGRARLSAEARRRLEQAGRPRDPAALRRARGRRRLALQRAAGARRQSEGRVHGPRHAAGDAAADRRERRRPATTSRCPTSSRTARRRWRSNSSIISDLKGPSASPPAAWSARLPSARSNRDSRVRAPPEVL